MPSYGIYTLANDVVYDQLVALLNSIEANVSPDMPVCVIPFNESIELVSREIATRPNVTLFDNWAAIQRWENLADTVWAAHPEAQNKKPGTAPWGKGHHRRLAAFDGPFDRFVFYDGDSLAMKPLDGVFAKLDEFDFVFDDWEHGNAEPVAALNIRVIEQTGLYRAADIRPKLHCSSFFGSKKGIFAAAELEGLQKLLVEGGEVAWVRRWWDDAFLFCYLTLRSDRPLFNFTLSPTGNDRTGNCADADPFVRIENVLYNEDGLKPIHRLHYMNYPAIDFARLAMGENVNIRYQDIFLHYRFMKQPDEKPQQLKSPSFLVKTSRKVQKLVKKVQKNILS